MIIENVVVFLLFKMYLISNARGTYASRLKNQILSQGKFKLSENTSNYVFFPFYEDLYTRVNKRNARNPWVAGDDKIITNIRRIVPKENAIKSRFPHYSMTGNWGAVGMPFNILYTPNSRQQKMMKFAPTKISNRFTPSKTQKPKETFFRKPDFQYFYLLSDDGKNLMKVDEKTLKRPNLRKYYSFIPHLFVSYGW